MYPPIYRWGQVSSVKSSSFQSQHSLYFNTHLWTFRQHTKHMSLFRGISSRRAPTCTFPNLVCSHANRMGKISFQSHHEEHPDVFAELKCTCTRGCLLQQLPGSLGKAMLTATKWCREQHGAKKLQGRGCWTSHQTCGFGSQLCIFLAGGLE